MGIISPSAESCLAVLARSQHEVAALAYKQLFKQGVFIGLRVGLHYAVKAGLYYSYFFDIRSL